MPPFLSIITVALNNLPGIKKTHQSIVIQDIDDYEWIVIDGRSDDGTVEFLQSLCIPNFKWISEEDEGLYDAMNKGILLAIGRYVLFLNSGDQLVKENVLSNIKECAETENLPELIYGDAYELDKKQHLLLKRAFSHKMIWYGMFTHHQSMFFLREAMPKKYSADFIYASDYGFVAQLLKRRVKVARVPFSVCIFESGGLSQTGSISVANHEQWSVRREVLSYSVWKCAAIYLLHQTTFVVKRWLPIVYVSLRYFRNVRCENATGQSKQSHS